MVLILFGGLCSNWVLAKTDIVSYMYGKTWWYISVGFESGRRQKKPHQKWTYHLEKIKPAEYDCCAVCFHWFNTNSKFLEEVNQIHNLKWSHDSHDFCKIQTVLLPTMLNLKSCSLCAVSSELFPVLECSFNARFHLPQ